MEYDGCFDLNDTFVVDSQNDLLDFENFDVLMPLFKKLAPTDAETVHALIENSTHEKGATEFESMHTENRVDYEAASVETDPSTETETESSTETASSTETEPEPSTETETDPSTENEITTKSDNEAEKNQV
jgi:hypothetical protein